MIGQPSHVPNVHPLFFTFSLSLTLFLTNQINYCTHLMMNHAKYDAERAKKSVFKRAFCSSLSRTDREKNDDDGKNCVQKNVNHLAVGSVL